jgi:hypothetical protein
MTKKPALQAVDSEETPSSAAIPDPFDLASLRLNPSFLETAGVKKLLTTVPSRRPNQQDFFRVRPEPEFRESLAMIELKDDREDYLVRPEVLPQLANEVVYSTLFTTINLQGVISLWPVKLPSADGKRNEWTRSAREAAERAMVGWIRLKANMSLGAYEIFAAECEMGEPEWPDLTFYNLLKISYRDRMITSLDHPVVKRLRGQT